MTNDLYTLPDLPYDFGALEPHISGRIMQLHHGEEPRLQCLWPRAALGVLDQSLARGWGRLLGRIVVQQVYDHQGNHGQGTVPLLAIDAWEHAFYLQYENRKTEYLEAIWSVVNWHDVARRFDSAQARAA